MDCFGVAVLGYNVDDVSYGRLVMVESFEFSKALTQFGELLHLSSQAPGFSSDYHLFHQ